jgi:hypothetical protein
MQRDAPGDPVAEHLRRIAQAEADLAQRLDAEANSMLSEQLWRMRLLAEHHHEALRQLGESRRVSLPPSRHSAGAAAPRGSSKR